MNCTEAHVAIGAEPQGTSAALEAHLRECASCAEFRREMLELDTQIQRALQIDLAALRSDAAQPAAASSEPRARPAVRLVSSKPSIPEKPSWIGLLKQQWALAASVLFAVGVVLVLWAALPRHTLAADVVAHVVDEPVPSSDEAVPPATLTAVLQEVNLRLDPISGEVVFAQTCFLRGRLIPHLVVRSGDTAITVLVLLHEPIDAPRHFDESGYKGVLLPNPGHGSIAVLSRSPIDSEKEARQILSALRLQPSA
jgi:hypothetical protein